MRGRPAGAAIRPHLGRHQPLRAGPEAHQHGLARPQFGKAEPAERLHVDEDVGRALAASLRKPNSRGAG